jgi:hypothetical protein
MVFWNVAPCSLVLVYRHLRILEDIFFLSITTSAAAAVFINRCRVDGKTLDAMPDPYHKVANV